MIFKSTFSTESKSVDPYWKNTKFSDFYLTIKIVCLKEGAHKIPMRYAKDPLWEVLEAANLHFGYKNNPSIEEILEQQKDNKNSNEIY